MKKEIIIAILIGLSLGLFITYGVYQAKTGISPKSNKDQNTLSINTTEEEFAGELVLNSPTNETIQKESSISVSGTTLPDSFVVVFIGNEENITSSDSSGNFSIQLELKDGANVITVVVLDENGRSIKLEITVIVSDETLVEEATDSAENTSESN